MAALERGSRRIFTVFLATATAFLPGTGAEHDVGCAPEAADPLTYDIVDLPTGERFYHEERNPVVETFDRLPGSGTATPLAFADFDSGASTVYRETNGINADLGSLQRDDRQLTDAHCGHGPDELRFFMGAARAAPVDEFVVVPDAALDPAIPLAGYIDRYAFFDGGLTLPCATLIAGDSPIRPCATLGGVFVERLATLLDESGPLPEFFQGTFSVNLCASDVTALVEGFGLNQATIITPCVGGDPL